MILAAAKTVHIGPIGMADGKLIPVERGCRHAQSEDQCTSRTIPSGVFGRPQLIGSTCGGIMGVGRSVRSWRQPEPIERRTQTISLSQAN